MTVNICAVTQNWNKLKNVLLEYFFLTKKNGILLKSTYPEEHVNLSDSFFFSLRNGTEMKCSQ